MNKHIPTKKRFLFLVLLAVLIAIPTYYARLIYQYAHNYAFSGYDKYYFFLHMPKTGGQTIDSIIRENAGNINARRLDTDLYFPEGDGFGLGGFEAFECYEPINSRFIKFVTGHYEYGLDCALEDDEYEYFTVLRDPLKRVFSYYSYFVYNGNFRWNGEIVSFHGYKDVGHEKAFKDFTEKNYFELDNAMTRRLSGVGRDVPIGEMNESHLEKAKENLKKFMLVGTLEEFDKFKFMLGEKFDFEIDYEMHVNKSEKKLPFSVLTKQQKQKILDMNKLDYELYEFGKWLSNKMFSKLPKQSQEKYYQLTSQEKPL